MSDHPTLPELFQQWETQHGQTSPEELCRDTPELLDALRAQIRERQTSATTSGVETHDLAKSGPIGVPTLADYEILAELGRGGIGVVYKARDVRLNRIVALKMLRPSALSNADLVERFRIEARAMAKLDHPHVVPILDNGECFGQPYFTMKFLAGGSLAQVRDRYQADRRKAVMLLVQIARAVHYLHENHILHRDLKPHNILLSEHDEPFVSDFGLAKYLDMESELTQQGEILGTYAYMAPEQAQGKVELFAPTSDVWSLGVMLYELLGGQRPFQGKNREDLLCKIVDQPPPPLQELKPDVPPELQILIEKCLRKNPAERFASAQQLADELQRWLDDKPILTRPEPWSKRALRFLRAHPVALSLLLAAIVLTPIVVYWRHPDRPLWQVQREQTRPGVVELQQADGSLRWHRWRTGGGVPKVVDRAVVLDSAIEFGLLELFDAPKLPYRFSTEVRHDQAAQNRTSEVGLFFDLHEHPDPQGAIYSFATLSYNDTDEIPGGNRAVMRIRLVSERKVPVGHPSDMGRGVGFNLTKKTQGAGVWRKLAVVVREDNVSVFFDDQPGPVIARKALRERAVGPALKIGELNAADNAFRGNGSIGLFNHASTVAFKNIRIESVEK